MTYFVDNGFELIYEWVLTSVCVLMKQFSMYRLDDFVDLVEFREFQQVYLIYTL